MASLPTILVIGLTLGCCAALRGIGFSIVYGALGEANLAYGDAVRSAPSWSSSACR